MDTLDDILKKNYSRIKKEVISPKRVCPKEDLLWSYIRGKLNKRKREQIDGHLLVCPECLESLKAIRMIAQAEKSSQKVPAQLHKRAKEILQKALAEPGMRPKNKPVIQKVVLLWDQLLNKITQLKPDLEEMIMPSRPALQPVRKVSRDVKEDLRSFPFRKTIEINEGTIHFEIDRSGKEGYVTLKTSFQFNPEAIPAEISNGRAILYKTEKIYSSVYFDQRGEAVFNRIKEGEYYLELFIEDKSLGMIEISLGKIEK